MKTPKIYILAIVFTIILLVVGFFLPGVLSVYRDKDIIGKVEFIKIESQQDDANNVITIIEKISLLKDYPQNVNRISLQTGMKHDSASMINNFTEEISMLVKLGLLPKDEYDTKGTVQIGVNLYAQKANPLISGVFWYIEFQKGDLKGKFYVDDYTGKIIQFSVTSAKITFSASKNPIEMWTKYLGVAAKNIQLEPKTSHTWEDEKIKTSKDIINVYNFELVFQDKYLDYAYYTFENGYGFGNIMRYSSDYNDTFIKIK